VTEYKLDKAGKLGPVAIVAESEQSLIITVVDQPTLPGPRKSLQLKKDLIDLVIYIK
jgi:hypothetical protein